MMVLPNLFLYEMRYNGGLKHVFGISSISVPISGGA